MGTNGAIVFSAVFTTLGLTPYFFYFSSREIIPRSNHAVLLNKPGLIPLVTGVTTRPIPKAEINTINS